MQVARWGSSLAVRIPAKTIKELDLKEGDEVKLDLTLVGTKAPPPVQQQRATALKTLFALPRTLPVDFRFDREEANSR